MRRPDPTFQAKARAVTWKLIAQCLVSGAALFVVFIYGLFGYRELSSGHPVAGSANGLVALAAALLWWRFVRRWAHGRRPIRCPVCGGNARVEGSGGGGADLVCSMCGQRATMIDDAG
jgi:hypothetical protein